MDKSGALTGNKVLHGCCLHTKGFLKIFFTDFLALIIQYLEYSILSMQYMGYRRVYTVGHNVKI